MVKKESFLTKASIGINKAMNQINMSFEDAINFILSNMVIMYGNLSGNQLDMVTAAMMLRCIKLFEQIVDQCTYDTEKLIRGLRLSDAGQKDIFIPKTIYSMDIVQRRTEINVIKQQMLDYKAQILSGKVPFKAASKETSLEVERGILRLKNSLNKLKHDVHICHGAKQVLKNAGAAEVVDQFLSYGRNDVLSISSVMFELYGNCKINLKEIKEGTE